MPHGPWPARGAAVHAVTYTRGPAAPAGGEAACLGPRFGCPGPSATLQVGPREESPRPWMHERGREGERERERERERLLHAGPSCRTVLIYLIGDQPRAILTMAILTMAILTIRLYSHHGRRGAHLVGDQPRARHERRCLGRIADRGLAPLQHRHGRTLRRPPVAGPELGCCAPSSKLALALAALGDSAHPGGEAGPRGAQPRPRVLEPCSRLQRRRLHGLRSRAGMAAAAGDVILSGFASIYFERVLKSVEETYSVR